MLCIVSPNCILINNCHWVKYCVRHSGSMSQHPTCTSVHNQQIYSHVNVKLQCVSKWSCMLLVLTVHGASELWVSRISTTHVGEAQVKMHHFPILKQKYSTTKCSQVVHWNLDICGCPTLFYDRLHGSKNNSFVSRLVSWIVNSHTKKRCWKRSLESALSCALWAPFINIGYKWILNSVLQLLHFIAFRKKKQTHIITWDKLGGPASYLISKVITETTKTLKGT